MSDYDRNQEDDKEILRKRIRDQNLDLFLAECEKEFEKLTVTSGVSVTAIVRQIAKRMRGE